MKIFYSGFNLYGQFLGHDKLMVNDFIDFTDNLVDITLGHTFSVVLKSNDILVYGAKNAFIHISQKIENICASAVVQTCCTDSRIIILTKTGTIYKIDLNNLQNVVSIPLAVDNKHTDTVVKIACGNKINVFLTQRGHLFNFPNKLNYTNQNVIDICCGGEHCLILDNKGDVYSFGRGSRGQLGHGHLNDEVEPKLIQALSGIKVVKIAAGGWHSCAISAEGDLYTWGWNSNGQLGIYGKDEGHIGVMATPHAVTFDNLDVNVIEAACGRRHTVAYLDDKKLYGAGWNKYHQLGKLEGENCYKMTYMCYFSNVNKLKCGPWSTAVMVI